MKQRVVCLVRGENRVLLEKPPGAEQSRAEQRTSKLNAHIGSSQEWNLGLLVEGGCFQQTMHQNVSANRSPITKVQETTASVSEKYPWKIQFCKL